VHAFCRDRNIAGFGKRDEGAQMSEFKHA
jgi:hypothetical protein